MKHLRIVPEPGDPRDDDGPGPDSPPPAEPPGPSSPTEAEGVWVEEDEPPGDAIALEHRVMLDRLARSLIYLASPGQAIAATVTEEAPGLLVAVFNADALPELAALLLRRADWEDGRG